MDLGTVLDWIKPNSFRDVFQPAISVRSTNVEFGETASRAANEIEMQCFFNAVTRSALAGLGALAFCKFVGYSPKKAAAALILGSIISFPTTLIGLGSYGIYKGFSHLIPAVSARSLSGVASASAVLLTGWVMLNNYAKISQIVDNFSVAEYFIRDFSSKAASRIADALYIKSPQNPQS